MTVGRLHFGEPASEGGEDDVGQLGYPSVKVKWMCVSLMAGMELEGDVGWMGGIPSMAILPVKAWRTVCKRSGWP